MTVPSLIAPHGGTLIDRMPAADERAARLKAAASLQAVRLSPVQHSDLICIATGRVIEFNSEKLKKLRDEICREHGFDPISHQFHIYGLSAEGKAQNGAAGKVKATISKAPRTSPR